MINLLLLKLGVIKMKKPVKWQDVKTTMTALSEKERRSIDLSAQIRAQIIEKKLYQDN